MYNKSLIKSLANLKRSTQQRQLNETTGSCACALPNEVSLYIQHKSKFTAGNRTDKQIESVIIMTSMTIMIVIAMKIMMMMTVVVSINM